MGIRGEPTCRGSQEINGKRCKVPGRAPGTECALYNCQTLFHLGNMIIDGVSYPRMLMCPVPWDYSQCGRQGASLCTGVRMSVRAIPRGSIAGHEGGGGLGTVCSYPVSLRAWVTLALKSLLCDLGQVACPSWIFSSTALLHLELGWEPEQLIYSNSQQVFIEHLPCVSSGY